MVDLMLSQRGSPSDIARLQDKGWLFDMKIDGVRCRAMVDHGKVTLLSRTGADMTHRYPEITDVLAYGYAETTIVLDGEIAVPDDTGMPSWPLTHKRDAQQARPTLWATKLPARFWAFDLLEFDAVDQRGLPYGERRVLLEDEALAWPKTLTTTICTGEGQRLWGLIQQHRLEGMIAKDPKAPYRAGRSPAWVKIKRTNTVSCLVGGFDPGEGSRSSTFGALHLFLLNAQDLVPVGKVGSGFSDRELKQVMQAMHHPPLIVEVEYLDVSPDGQLRQPVFQRVRTDLAVTDCTMDQLEEE